MALGVNLIVRPAAIADLHAARSHYDEARPGLGDEFARDLDRLFGRLAIFPRSAPAVVGYEPVRRARVRRFPYSVFYVPTEKSVEILRVIHIARSPDAWRTGS